MNPLAPLPDEISWSYLYRIERLLGSGRLRTLWQRFQSKHGKRASKIRFAAEILEQPIDHFICKHSLVPFRHCVATQLPFAITVDSFLDEAALEPQRRLVYRCTSCENEDQEWYGFSYWRRSHQIPGVHRCCKHEIGLCAALWVEGGSAVWPDILLPSSDLEYSPVDCHSDPVVLQYEQAALSVLDLPRPISTLTFVARIRRHFESLLHVESKPSFGSVGCVEMLDRLLQGVPGSWLMDLLKDSCKHPSAVIPTGLGYGGAVNRSEGTGAYRILVASLITQDSTILANTFNPNAPGPNQEEVASLPPWDWLTKHSALLAIGAITDFDKIQTRKEVGLSRLR